MLAALGCSSSPSKTECETLVNHMIDVFTAGKSGDAEPAPPKDYVQALEKWRKLLKDDKDATHESLISVCTSQMSSGVTSCVLAAGTEVDLARCFGG